jgi:hypothetical protein
VHGRYDLKNASIVSKIFLTDESLIDKVSITPVFSENGLTVTIDVSKYTAVGVFSACR